MASKIHMLADGRGRPLRFILAPGQASDIPQAPALLKGRRAGHVIADAAYDSRALRAVIAGAAAVPPPARPAVAEPIDRIRCYRRHLVILHRNRLPTTLLGPPF